MEKGKDQGLTIRFRGVRGSYPVPGPTTLKYGGNTTCVEVRAGGQLVILDAGTGIVPLGNELFAEHGKTGRPIVATILMTHTHHDHTQGFPFFLPAHLASSRLYMFGPDTGYAQIEEALAQGLIAPLFPVSLGEMKSMREIRTITEDEVVLLVGDNPPICRHRVRGENDTLDDPVVITLRRGVNHPKTGVLHYKIRYGGKAVVFATDTEGYVGGDQRLTEFCQGVDLLIHDAQYFDEDYLRKQGWGHSTHQMACEVAMAAGVKSLALTHHDPAHDDARVEEKEKAAKEIFPHCFAAREGLVIEL